MIVFNLWPFDKPVLSKHLYISGLALVFLSSVFLSSCSNSTQNSSDKITSVDTITCWVDSSLQVLAQEQVKAFHNIYKFPRLKLQIHSEADIVKGLLDNQVNLAILHRNLDSVETGIVHKRESFMPKQYEYAFDAYVLVTSRTTEFDSVNLNAVLDYLEGRPSVLKAILVENIKSQSLMFLKQHFQLENKALSRLNSLGTLSEMMTYLRSSKQTIGVLPFSLIADIEAEKTVKFLEGLKVLKLSYKDKTGKTITIEPSQSSIATKEYPLISPIVLVNCNMDKKSGTNFVNYIFKPKAQRLIQQFGLCPAVFPGREIVIQQ